MFLIVQPSRKQDLYLVYMIVHVWVDLCSNKFHVSERSVLLTLWPKNLQHLALAPRMDLPAGNLLSPEYWGFFHDSIFFHPMNWFNMLQPLSPDPGIFPDLHHGYEASANWVPPSEASFARTKHSPHKWSANDQEWMVHRTLTGFNRRLILVVATRIFFPSSFLYSEETNKNICKWLTTTFSKLNPAPISQLLEHSQHCFVPLYVRTLPPKQIDVQIYVMALISLCLWYIRYTVLSQKKHCNVPQQVPVTNHTMSHYFKYDYQASSKQT